ncbi:MAG: anaerobic nitric oxide reductase flavorubredoxin [Tissierella sp.]|uniref:anaerobic nitric oxide reductase flavorubredoxin n=1 Tax=Tissierella sp. TaxID=41274 RepID=UPI003F97A8A7
MGFKMTDKVTWVGKIDWELRSFHGEEYSTHRGSSYNSYLVRDEKNVLIDTAWAPFADEYLARLKEEIDLNDIDYIIAQHNEIDHSGALPLIIKEIPNVPIYCTENGAKIIKAHFHEADDWNFKTVKTGDTLDIGESTLTFVEARMLHWPDSMMTYMDGDNILFSNDAFGQHYASDLMYNDTVDQCELFEEAIKYYANILTPFSPLVTMKIKEILSFELPLNMIAPSHGVIWRDNPAQIVEKYLEWADGYKEDQIVLIYDSMWGATRRMAEAIAEGIKEVDEKATVKLFNAAKTDKNEVITEMFKSKAFMFGSSTVNKGIMHATGGLLEMIRGIGFKDKTTAGFGSYGWSGESVKLIDEKLKATKLKVVEGGPKELWNPDEDAINNCIEFGKEFAKEI